MDTPSLHLTVPVGIPRMARTFPLAREAVVSFRTQPGGAGLPGVAGLTQTHSVDVVAFAVILTATFLCAASAVRANWTLVLATVEKETHQGTFCFVLVSLASYTKQLFLSSPNTLLADLSKL